MMAVIGYGSRMFIGSGPKLGLQYSCPNFIRLCIFKGGNAGYNQFIGPSLSSTSKIRLKSSFKMAEPIVENKYDLVIYGATGFTGQYVLEEFLRVKALEKEKGNSLVAAVAGRNSDKLKAVVKDSTSRMGEKVDQIEVLVADSKDPSSLAAMAAQAKVLINCVGPYFLYGEPVVQACIENKANYVDISGEPQFLERMQLKYDKAAEKAGVHIVGACGYDSIPADVGVSFMKKSFSGELNSVECFLRTRAARGASIHTGTMESAALAFANRNEVEQIRRQLYPTKLPKPKFKKEQRGVLHKNPDLNRWCLRLPTDEPMVYRSQRYLQEAKGARPVQFQGFMTCGSYFSAIGMLVGALYFFTLCFFKVTRTLLFKFPKAMTAGVFSSEGPTREQLENMTFTSTLIGKGWKDKLSEGSDEYNSPPDTKLIVKVSGKDPGYYGTALMMVASAMTILREKPLCQRPGGVLPPGATFCDTHIVDRLRERGMEITFEKDAA